MSSKENGDFDMPDDISYLKNKMSKLEGSITRYKKALSRIQKELFKSNFQLQLIEQNLKYVKKDRYISRVEFLKKITKARKDVRIRIVDLEKIINKTISEIDLMEKDMRFTKNKIENMEKEMRDKILPFKKNGR
jgi:predicted  nucleic acid-binding Zn-ribbon protein